MADRLRIAALVLLIAIVGAGCRSTLNSCCDRCPSLADWLDCHGCTGCVYGRGSECAHCGQCSDGSPCDRCVATVN